LARAEYIYVVTASGIPVAAFTVKHELVAWRDRYLVNVGIFVSNYRVFRLRDNSRYDEPVELNWMYLERRNCGIE
jgi:hypothetical protein